MCVRCRRPDISLRKIEQMALDAARSHIEKEKLEWIWAMTTFGVSFRVWFVDKDAVRLILMHGTATDGDEGQYIDVASPEASVVSNDIEQTEADADKTPEDAPKDEMAKADNTTAAGAS
ncbi:uncharacterized protein AUP68_09542 [Ilyonectria robusta]